MDATAEPDWRAEQLLDKEYLVGVRFQRKRHRTYREGWDHDHCVGCWATFAERDVSEQIDEPVLHDGFTTCEDFEYGAEYWWICLDCWATFKGPMKWTEAVAETEGETGAEA
ncbi:hypothetical protein [Caulobacter sp. DWR2-3-1b2]|uniref:hypothetical protein n=1 Tax=unclassified Caulobacter TaxID=2648921 RepID=UPI003CEDFAE7